MTKYRTYTDEELLRQWDSLEPLYLLAEAKKRMIRLVDKGVAKIEYLQEDIAYLRRDLEECQEAYENAEETIITLTNDLDDLKSQT